MPTGTLCTPGIEPSTLWQGFSVVITEIVHSNPVFTHAHTQHKKHQQPKPWMRSPYPPPSPSVSMALPSPQTELSCGGRTWSHTGTRSVQWSWEQALSVSTHC
ncbi:unnamed protein product [Gadus morhua 'NCC']